MTSTNKTRKTRQPASTKSAPDELLSGGIATVSNQNTQATPTANSDEDLVRATLRAVCTDPDAPANAKAQAARTLGEIAGVIGRNAKPIEDTERHAGSMSRAEIEAELAAL